MARKTTAPATAATTVDVPLDEAAAAVETVDTVETDAAATDAEAWEYVAPEGQTDDDKTAETDDEPVAETVETAEPVETDETLEELASQRAGGTPRETVDRIVKLRTQGGLSFRAIAAKLDEEGRHPLRATAWTGQGVRSIVVRELGADNIGTATVTRRGATARTVWVIATRRKEGVRAFTSEDAGLKWLAAQTGSLPAPVQVTILDEAAVDALLAEADKADDE